MPEIGATLREARMRARIDISEIEAETKIRAKYLRALENEEWDLLPGPTYVKSFLKTYAEALGLDARLLVEEYKLRHERLSDQELSRPIGSPTAPGRRRPAPPGLPPGAIIAACVVALLVGLFVLGKLTGNNDDGNPKSSAATTTTSSTPSRPSTTTTTTPRKPPAPSKVRLTLTANAPVYVCLRAAGNRTLIRGETLVAGAKRGPFRASSYKLNLGNNSVTLRVNGKTVPIAASSGAIGMSITRKGRSSLPTGQRPLCQ
ncbi:MAG: cytoskeleton protein RodZ [Gaiellales bacterium]|nr:cytoskeleton protein RodZ [Gaiellales bacterium]